TTVDNDAKLLAFLVDPSLFTAPYDAALDAGLSGSGVQTRWMVRPLRPGDRDELPPSRALPLFYRHIDQLGAIPERLRKVLKGASHLSGLVRLASLVRHHKPDVLHFQWTVVPPLDWAAALLMRKKVAIVLTVHDTLPHNGERVPFVQRWAFDLPIHAADRVIVHTHQGRKRLLDRGIPAEKISVIAHGPLCLPPELDARARESTANDRTTFTLFGEIKHYKGWDVLVEAVGLIPPEVRARIRILIAGRVQMDVGPILARIEQLGIRDIFELSLERQSERQMAELFSRTDCFVFPYRAIDASGVYFLTGSYSRWMIASDTGIFRESLREEESGNLVAPERPDQLARAMIAFHAKRRRAPEKTGLQQWSEIGRHTHHVYKAAILASKARA
ncbi:MAG: hypothetical protein JWN04_512, partial [Myxococcaceae bacterium]|nr:hypothetical protein [Myxococcaceae bacterium]